MCQWSLLFAVTMLTTLCRELFNRFTAQGKSVLSTAPEVHARSCCLDNGIEFANAIFKGLCDLLNIEVSRSLTGFAQSNGLVKGRHRDILQSLRKILVDSGDYSNWSEYIPIVQLQIYSTISKVTGHSPYNLMFGSDHSPRADPSDMQAHQLPELNKHKKPFNKGDLVLVLKTNGKLHGCFAGPFLIEVKSNKSLLPKNLVTGSMSMASNHCKLHLSDFPKEDIDWHNNIAAGDMEESIIIKITDHFDLIDSNNNKVPYCTAVWYGGGTLSVPVTDVKSTEAYQSYLRTLGPRTSRKRKVNSDSKSKTKPFAVNSYSCCMRSKRGER
ncbi:hypothetical protein P9112_009149 [Eukaryota sp. TZLM1-RC]